jgi:putative transcriptional regulator
MAAGDDGATRHGVLRCRVPVRGCREAARFAALAALCEVLSCQPGDLLRSEPADAGDAGG